MIDPFVQQRRIHLRGGEIHEARRVQHVENTLPFRRSQRTGRRRPVHARGRRVPLSVVRGGGHA
jgi:hypothetical protein